MDGAAFPRGWADLGSAGHAKALGQVPAAQGPEPAGLGHQHSALDAGAIGTAHEAGCTGKILVRFASASCNSAVIRTIRRRGAFFSVTVRANSFVRNTTGRIPEEKWTPVEYPQAI
jgi:hypothetical protein